MKPVSIEYMREKCKPGIESGCRYSVFYSDKWQCAKGDKDLAPYLDRKAKAGCIKNRGDNCQGIFSEEVANGREILHP